MSVPLRLVARVACVALVALVQWLLVSIPEVDHRHFDRWAAELDRTARWRYGYVPEFHGVSFVKTRTRADAPALQPPGGDDRLSQVLARELREGPWRASAELAFYAVLFALYRYGCRGLGRLRTHPAATRLRFTAAAALCYAAFVTAAMAPYLICGYGEPLFSNCHGPGALGCTGLVPTTPSTMRSAVSYGQLLQSLLTWPLLATEWAARPLSAALGIRGSLWTVAMAFWSAVGALASALLYDRGLSESRNR